MTEKEKMVAGLPYDARDPELLEGRTSCQRVLREFNGQLEDEAPARETLLGGLLASVGEDTYVKRPFICDYGYNTSIGDRSFVNYGAVILDVTPVRIGDEVLIATNVQILAAEHPVDPAERRRNVEYGRPVEIGDGVWLGGGAIVCPGVRIGEGSVIGAGSVVTRDVPPGVVAVGNPCRPVRSIA